MSAGDVTREGRVIAGELDGVPIEWQPDPEYARMLEASSDRFADAHRATTARLKLEAAASYRRGVRDGVLLASLVVASCGVVLAVFVAAFLNGGAS